MNGERTSLSHQASPRNAGELVAFSVARDAHRGQVDKAGNEYLTAHVADVVRRIPFSDTRARVVAWLHDVLEDTDVTADQLRGWQFLPTTIAAVQAITHHPHEPRVDYYARVKANPLALRVKLADIASNTDPARMALLDEATRGRLTKKYRKALEALT